VQANHHEQPKEPAISTTDRDAAIAEVIAGFDAATILALTPLAAGFNQGSIIAAELGTVVIGGLFSSTFLTLLVVPVVYSLADGARQWRRRPKARSRGRLSRGLAVVAWPDRGHVWGTSRRPVARLRDQSWSQAPAG
jgi:AcrB/AcrD/AcrF family